MERKVKNIDELFKNKLNNHEVEPPAYLWNNINQELDYSESIDDFFKKSFNEKEVIPPAYVWDNINASLDKLSNRYKSRIWWLIGSGAAVIAAFIAGYFIADSIQNEGENQSFAITQQEQILSENILHSVEENTKANKKERNNRLNFSIAESTKNNASTHTETTTLLATIESKNINANKIAIENIGNTEKTVRAETSKGTFTNKENKGKPSDKPYDNSSEGKNHVLNDSKNEIKRAEELPAVNEQAVTEAKTEALGTNESNQVMQNNQSATEKMQEDVVNTKQVIDLYEGLDPVSSYYPLFSISPFFSPMYAIRNSFNDESKYDPITPGNDDRFNHSTRFSYQAGVLLGYNFTRNISVHIGCSYNQITHSTGRGQLQTIPFSQASIYDSALTVQTSAGQLTGISVNPNLDNPEIGPTINIEQTLLQSPIERIVQTIGFVEVPVLIRYRIATSRVGFLFTGGFSSGFVVRNDAFAENQTEYVRFGETANIRNVNFNLVLGTGLDVQITPWMFFTFEPTFRYSLMNWSTNKDVKINPIMIGANTGLSFRF